MRLPVRSVAGNRLFAHDGSVWAIWRVALPSYPFQSDDGKLALHARAREALTTLPRRAQLIAVHRPVQPAELAGRVAAGVPSTQTGRWRRAARTDTLALIASGPMERRVYLAAEVLPARARGVLDAGVAAVSAALGLAAPRPAVADDRAAKVATDELAARLGRTLDIAAVGHQEVWWLCRRAFTRGWHEPPPPTSTPARDGRPRRPPAGITDAVLHEGGGKGDPGRGRHRRYVRVDTDAGPSFQTTLVVSDMPAAFRYPGGGEWFAVADLAPFGVDWVARIDAVPNVAAAARARRQQRQLTAQVAEYEGEPAGPPRTLAAALDGIADEQAALADHPGDPELEATIAFTVWGGDVSEVDARAAQLADLLEPWGYALHRPTGGQVDLLGAGLPASTPPAVCGDYVQYLLPRDFAAGAPFAGSAVGDPQGLPLGLSLTGGTPEPVLLDPAHGPATNRSGSLGVFGALGSGKSFFIKRVVLGTVGRGGQVVTLDRTAAGEYARLAESIGAEDDAEAEVVRLDPTALIGLDPLRVFAGEDRVRVGLGFLSMLTRTTPTDLDGAVLSAAVRAVAAADGRLGDVIDWLRTASEPEADTLARKLAAHADQPLAQLVFGDREPLRLDADFICFHAPGLSLPDRDAVQREHLAKQLLPEQVFAQALLYLVAAVSRALVFSDPGRFGAVLIDEAWALTASPQGRQLLLDAIRDGRKHNAAVWLLSQHPDDLGDDALTDLLGMRALFRQSRGAAPAALSFMGLDPTDDLVELLSAELRTGQCLLRDVADRVGLVQVLAPTDPAVLAALDTTPAAVA